MATHYVPIIRSREDYEAIRQLPQAHFPDPFDKWEQDRANDLWQIARGGTHGIKGIEVKPQEFADYCRSAQRRPDFDAIKAFIQEKAAGQKNGDSGISGGTSPQKISDE